MARAARSQKLLNPVADGESRDQHKDPAVLEGVRGPKNTGHEDVNADLDDSPHPQNTSPRRGIPEAAAEDTGPAAAAEEKEAKPSFNSARDAIAKRFRERRLEEDGEGAEPTPENFETPPAFRREAEAPSDEDEAGSTDQGPEEEPAAPRRRQPKPQPEEKLFRIKVLDKEYDVDKERLCHLAGIEQDEFDDFPEQSLVRLAQKQAAADELLDQAKIRRRSERLDDARPASDEEADPNLDLEDAQDQRKPRDPIEDFVETLTYGDPKDAADKLRQVLTGVQGQDEERAIDAAERLVTTTVAAKFEADNPDVVSDGRDEIFYTNFVVPEIKRDMIAAGSPPDKVEQYVGGNLRNAVRLHLGMTRRGAPLSDPGEILDRAADRMRTMFGSATRQQPQQPSQRGSHDRLAQKRSLQPQPTRSSSTPPERASQADQSGQRSFSSAIQRMRQMRGQPTG